MSMRDSAKSAPRGTGAEAALLRCFWLPLRSGRPYQLRSVPFIPCDARSTATKDINPHSQLDTNQIKDETIRSCHRHYHYGMRTALNSWPLINQFTCRSAGQAQPLGQNLSRISSESRSCISRGKKCDKGLGARDRVVEAVSKAAGHSPVPKVPWVQR